MDNDNPDAPTEKSGTGVRGSRWAMWTNPLSRTGGICLGLGIVTNSITAVPEIRSVVTAFTAGFVVAGVACLVAAFRVSRHRS